MHRITIVTALALCAVVGGCGIADPYRTATSPPARRVIGPPARPSAGETDGPPAARHPSAAAAGRPQALIARYAQLYLNWTPSSLIEHQRQLASMSLGQARGQAQLSAAQAERARQEGRLVLSNQGQALAIAPGRGPAAGRWVIVTSELTSGQAAYAGLPPTLHIIYAQLTRSRGGWVITAWQPQN